MLFQSTTDWGSSKNLVAYQPPRSQFCLCHFDIMALSVSALHYFCGTKKEFSTNFHFHFSHPNDITVGCIRCSSIWNQLEPMAVAV